MIGLHLCPFAAPVVRSGRLRMQVSEARLRGELLGELCRELAWFASADAQRCETMLLIHPWVLADFLDFNEFLGDCERALEALDLEGIVQIASFHPQFQFAGTQPEDIGNCTNRSPYPTLHLLREASIDRAVGHLEDPDEIYRANIRTLQALGREGWAKLWRD